MRFHHEFMQPTAVLPGAAVALYLAVGMRVTTSADAWRRLLATTVFV